MGTVNVIQLLTTAVIEMLARPVVDGGTGHQVGDHKAPAARPTYPYHVVHQVPGGEFDGAGLVDPEGMAGVVFQVNSVGKRRDQAQLAADTVRQVMLGRDGDGEFLSELVAPNDWVICGRVPDGGPPGVDPEGTPPNTIFTVSERFVVTIAPGP